MNDRGQYGQPVSRWPTQYRAAGRSRWPLVRPAPRMPDLSDGKCQPGRSDLSPEAWSDPGDDEMREAAIALCGGCPCLSRCRSWVLGMPPPGKSDRAIWAGMTRGQIDRARRRDL